jgi:hypothetical protein
MANVISLKRIAIRAIEKIAASCSSSARQKDFEFQSQGQKPFCLDLPCCSSILRSTLRTRGHARLHFIALI